MKKIFSLIIASLFLVSLVSAVNIVSVITNPTEIEPGENARISLEIKNNLEKDLVDVEISLDLSDLPLAPYQSGTSKVFDDLGEGKSKSMNFNIIALANAESGTYKIPVDISYREEDENEIMEKTTYISILVNAKPELDLSYEGNLIKGRDNEIVLKIVNSGLSGVKLLNLRVEDTIGLKVLNSKQVYIGEIESDDFDSASFNVFISETSPSNINLPVKITYRDSLNENYEDDVNLVVKAYSQEQAENLGLIKKSNTSTIVISVIVLIVLFVVYRKIKKWRKSRKAKEV